MIMVKSVYMSDSKKSDCEKAASSCAACFTGAKDKVCKSV